MLRIDRSQFTFGTAFGKQWVDEKVREAIESAFEPRMSHFKKIVCVNRASERIGITFVESMSFSGYFIIQGGRCVPECSER